MNVKFKYKITNVGAWYAVGNRFVINGATSASIRICDKEYEDPLTITESYRYLGQVNDLFFCSKRPSETLSVLDNTGRLLKTLEQGTYATNAVSYKGCFYFQARSPDNLRHWYCYNTVEDTLKIVFENQKFDRAFLRKSCMIVFSKSHLTLRAWNDHTVGKTKLEISKSKDLNLKIDVPSDYKYIDIGDDKLLICYRWEQLILVDLKEEKIVFNKSMGFLNLDPDNESMAFYDQLSKTIYSYSFEGHLLESFSIKGITAIDVVPSNLTLKYLNGQLLVSTPDLNLLLLDKAGKILQKYTLPEELRSKLNYPPNMFLANRGLLAFRGGESAFSPFVVYELLK